MKYISTLFLTILSLQIMAQKEINTSITINATPEKVWKILTDYDAYPDWNPFLSLMEGDFEKGNKVKIVAGGMTFKPIILNIDDKKEIRWKGKFLIKGLFDGEHILRIKNNNDGTITFHQEEIFTGLLVGLFSKKLDNETKPGFEEMNLKLKELAEK